MEQRLRLLDEDLGLSEGGVLDEALLGQDDLDGLLIRGSDVGPGLLAQHLVAEQEPPAIVGLK